MFVLLEISRHKHRLGLWVWRWRLFRFLFFRAIVEHNPFEEEAQYKLDGRHAGERVESVSEPMGVSGSYEFLADARWDEREWVIDIRLSADM